MNTITKTSINFNYKAACTAILRTLRRDRDRQIVAKRFGFGLSRRQTLEQIGRGFGITRERVRQIEKATLIKIAGLTLPEITQADQLIGEYLEEHGYLSRLDQVASAMGAATPQDQSYILFLATLAPNAAVIDEDDQLRQSISQLPEFPQKTVAAMVSKLIKTVEEIGSPSTLKQIGAKMTDEISDETLYSLASISEALAEYDGKWGLISWPQVNPKSIRDKTYLVLAKHGQPLHFTAISEHIKNSNFRRRDVTVQAVHNELIKDSRFILIGRGIYALAEWGYEPGTVADIIIDVLRKESPLHKDEIVKRVLAKRQVRTTTIVLNLQEKDHFVRVAKATYQLKSQL